jgi:hypothetical protein
MHERLLATQLQVASCARLAETLQKHDEVEQGEASN